MSPEEIVLEGLASLVCELLRNPAEVRVSRHGSRSALIIKGRWFRLKGGRIGVRPDQCWGNLADPKIAEKLVTVARYCSGPPMSYPCKECEFSKSAK